MRFLFVFILLCSSFVFAEEADIRPFAIDGKSFVCFDLNSSTKLLQLRIDLPKLELKISKLEELVTIKAHAVLQLEAGNKNLTSQMKEMSSEIEDLQEFLDSANAWWRNPYFWFSVGAVLATGTSLSIFYAAR